MSRKIEGMFEVIEIEDMTVTFRHLATSQDFTVQTADHHKFAELLPLGTRFMGSMEIEDGYVC